MTWFEIILLIFVFVIICLLFQIIHEIRDSNRTIRQWIEYELGLVRQRMK